MIFDVGTREVEIVWTSAVYVEMSTIDDELRSTQRCYFYKGLAADTCLNVSAFRIPAVLAVLLK